MRMARRPAIIQIAVHHRLGHVAVGVEQVGPVSGVWPGFSWASDQTESAFMPSAPPLRIAGGEQPQRRGAGWACPTA